MTLNRRLYCLVDPEPEKYYAKRGAYAVNLSFECTSEVPETDCDAAKLAYKHFLEQVQGPIQFVSYRVDNLKLADPVVVTDRLPLPPTLPTTTNQDLHRWLEKRATTPSKFWISPDAGSEVDVETAGAGALLRAVQAWNAPIGHHYGLTYVIWADTGRVVVPFLGVPFDPKKTFPEITFTRDGVLPGMIKFPAPGAIGEGALSYHYHTVILEEPQDQFLGGRLTEEGYLQVTDKPMSLSRFLNGFEQRGASMLSATPALVPPDYINPNSSTQADETAYRKLFEVKDNILPPIYTWVAVAGLLTLLDNFVITLLRPISGTRSEGELLYPLISKILDAISKVTPQASTNPPRAKVRDAIRSVLRQSPLFPKSNRDGLAALVESLRVAHDLDAPMDGQTTPARQFLIALLNPQNMQGDDFRPVPLKGEQLNTFGGTSAITMLAKALAEVQTNLNAETAAETTILRLFETAVPDTDNHPTPTVALRIAEAIFGTPDDIQKSAVAEGWASYCALLKGPFLNGADVVRHNAGLEFLNALLPNPTAVQVPPLTSREVAQKIIDADYFQRRMLDEASRADEAPAENGTPKAFDEIVASLVQIKPVQFADTTSAEILAKQLQHTYARTMRGIGDLDGEGKRFIPDLAPQPLPMQIAGDVSGELLNTFLSDFNGIAIAISREESSGISTPFAHANLAELTWPGQAPTQKIISIHPFLPTVNDGRGPAFIEYHGGPFVDNSHGHLRVDSPTIEETKDPSRQPFYQAGLGSLGSDKLPRLAYGCRFRNFAFATTNAGTLPFTQQLDSERTPWLPSKPQAPNASLIATTNYQRRTAIGEIELTEVDAEGQVLAKGKQRLNRAIPDVVALASDYPRRSLIAPASSWSTLDLFRESDGIGTLILDEDDPTQVLELAFNDVQLSGGGTLYLQLLDGPVGHPGEVVEDAKVELTEELRSATSFRLTITSQLAHEKTLSISWGATSKILQEKIQAKKDALFWLRLTLKGDQNITTMSFADQDGPKGSRPAPELLLLAPPEERVWLDNLVSPATTLRVRSPRVGYLDFQRWMANNTLRDAAFGEESLRFVNALEQLYKIRNLSPALVQFFDRLPDPTVRGISYTLCETDRLIGEVIPSPLVQEVMWGELKKVAEEFVSLWPAKMNEAIKGLMDGIDRACSFTLTLASGSTWSMDAKSNLVKCTIPAGTVAHLSIEALVSEKHFSAPNAKDLAPIDAGLLQFASAKSDIHYTFPLAALCIETMSNTIADRKQATTLAEKVIGLEAAGSARRYDIVAGAQEPPSEWRLYSHASVHTQQWLYSGRPLYRSLEPRDHAFPGPSGKSGLSAALRLDSDKDVYEFENELFFNRSNTDSADSAPKKLEPLPAKTVLHFQTWDSPSATYWRHRFTLRSRYAGALIKADRREVEAFLKLNDNSSEAKHLAKTWTMRAVMLADLSRVQLTRPQLRALIPLTTAIGGGTPSVLAVLQEPPLAVGGLAERTTAELKTGFGYGFAPPPTDPDFPNDPPNSPPVEILDARKEIGPDPTLAYSAMPAEEAANLALMAEGPIGLTFDARHAASPAFANAMYSLTPTSLNGELVRALEEHFLGVTLQRHLDPGWLYTPVDSGLEHETSRCWWITYELPEIAVKGKNIALVAAGGLAILELERRDEKQIAFMMSKAALDGQKGFSKHFVELCALQSKTRIAVLHQPMAAGQYGLSIFLHSKTDISEGNSGGWLRVASVEWSVPQSSSAPLPLVTPSEATVIATAASAATFIAWTRTHRDFANLTLHGDNSPRAMASDVLASLSGKELSFHYPRDKASLHLTPSTYSTVEPIHRHRHLGFILTRLRDDDGRPVEQFHQHGLFVGKTITLGETLSSTARLNVRIVEIEVPAVIVGARRIVGLPHEYQSGLLDLVATVGDRDKAPEKKIKLFLRLAGSDEHVRKFNTITLHIQSITSPGTTKEESIKITLDLSDGGVRSIELGINPGEVFAKLIGLDGTPRNVKLPKEVQNKKAILAGATGIEVSIETQEGTPECWCDISMLHTRTDNQSGQFDLRWLFSEDTSIDMAQALQPSAMGGRTEAQARIVSVSPPIPVVS